MSESTIFCLNQTYQVIKPLGKGSFGTVFLCKDESDKKVAVKKFNVPGHLSNDQIRKILIQAEVEKSQMYHPNILRTFSFEKDKYGDVYQISEYSKIGNLKKFNGSRRSSEPRQEQG